MKCVFSYFDLHICLSSCNLRIVEYCVDYFKNYFECFGAAENISFWVELLENDEVDPHFRQIHTETAPFPIYYCETEKRIILTNIDDTDAHEVMRLLRELFISHISGKKELLFLHAACVANKNYAIAITGDKYSGKTTLCLEFLKNGWDYVSNDKLILQQKRNGRIACWGLPIALGIREATRQIFNQELTGLTIDKYDKRYYITPNRLIERFGIDVQNDCPLKLIIVPQYCESITTTHIQEIPRDEKRLIIRKQHMDSLYAEKRMLRRGLIPYKKIPWDCLGSIPMYRITFGKLCNYEKVNIIETAIKRIDNG